MNLIRLHTVFGFFLILMLFIVLTGCNTNSKNEFAGIIKDTETNDKLDIDSKKSYVGDSVLGTNSDSINYEQYLKKIWIVKDWDGEAYCFASFSIIRLEDGIIEGRLTTGEIAEPEFYSSNYFNNPHLPNFEDIKNLPNANLFGKINNDVAECQFEDEHGNKGNVTIVFNENDEIEATIKYTYKEESYKDLCLDGIYTFRPYNISDIEGIDQLMTNSISIDLNYWGNVKIESLVVLGNKPHPSVFLTDNQGNIFYRFSEPYQTGSKVIDIALKDLNGDGLKDITIITAFYDYKTGLIYSDMPQIEWVLYQMKNGLFYDSILETK